METKEIEKEFLTMIEAQKRTIYKVCYIYANDQDDLNDLYQETVLNLWKSFPRYRGDSKLTTWVYRIAMNTCITFLRRSNARPQTIPMTANVASMAAEDNETAGQLRELYRLISQLGKLERALILLWLEERSYEEIADILGITKTNVAEPSRGEGSNSAEDHVGIRPRYGSEHLQLRGEYAHHLCGIPLCLYEYAHPGHLICHRRGRDGHRADTPGMETLSAVEIRSGQGLQRTRQAGAHLQEDLPSGESLDDWCRMPGYDSLLHSGTRIQHGGWL